MVAMHWLFLLLLGFLATTIEGLPQPDTSVDPADPNKSDPTSFPDHNFTLSDSRGPDLFPNGIPTLPDECDSYNLTEDCFHALQDVGEGAYIWYEKNHGCDKKKKKKIEMAFNDAQEMLSVASSDNDGLAKDIISADYWLGPNWRGYAYRAQENIKRASDFKNDASNRKSYFSISCSDPLGYCADLEQPKGEDKKRIGGYAWDYKGWFGYVYGHINMCDRFYDLQDMSEIRDRLNWYRERDDKRSMQMMNHYAGLAQYIIHEMMHLKSTYGSEPKIVDVWLDCAEKQNGKIKTDRLAYGAKRARLLARGDKDGSGDSGFECTGGQHTTINADSYAMLINSIFWYSRTGYFPGASSRDQPVDPPDLVVPHVSFDNDTDFSTQSFKDKFSEAFDMYLTGSAEDDVNKSNDSGEPDDKPPTPAADVNSCRGLGGDYWVMSRDTAVQNVEDFCRQSEHTKKYNEGSVNELELSVKKVDDDGKSPQDSPDCVGRFTGAVIDGCDGGDKINNPHNYKFGSTLTTGDGWSYTMTPLSKQVNEVTCDVAYKVFFDGFEIRGKNWPDAKFGENGEGLHDQIAGCGAITRWSFEWTPNDCCFQWYASGQLPFGTKACVGRAIESAGSSGKDNCHGAGKRAPVSRDAIDNWPGYGDEGRHVLSNDGPTT